MSHQELPEVVSQNASPPVRDPAQLRTISLGDHEMERDLASVFLENLEPMVGKVESAHRQRDAEALRRALHGLKGACLNLGAEALGALAKRLEASAAANDWASLESNIQCVRPLSERTAENFRAVYGA